VCVCVCVCKSASSGDQTNESESHTLGYIFLTNTVHVSVVQRQWFRTSCFFLTPYRSTLVDVPFVLRIVPEATTGQDLYELVSKQLGLPLPKSRGIPGRKHSKSTQKPAAATSTRNAKKKKVTNPASSDTSSQKKKEVTKVDSTDDEGVKGVSELPPHEEVEQPPPHMTRPRYKRRWGFELRVVNQVC
jgi:hypothetical protein